MRTRITIAAKVNSGLVTLVALVAISAVVFSGTPGAAVRWTMGTLWVTVLVTVFVATRRLLHDLRGVAAKVAESADRVATGAAQLASASQVLAQGAAEQVEKLDQTAGSGAELASICRQGAESTRSAAQQIVESNTFASDVTMALVELSSAMTETNESSDLGKISRINRVGEEIAFQRSEERSVGEEWSRVLFRSVRCHHGPGRTVFRHDRDQRIQRPRQDFPHQSSG